MDMEFTVSTYGEPDSGTLLIQMTDDHEMEMIGQEAALIRELSGGQDFCLKAVRVNRWNYDLSPWPAPAVFGKEDFGDGAAALLAFILQEVISSSSRFERAEPATQLSELKENRSSRFERAEPATRLSEHKENRSSRFERAEPATRLSEHNKNRSSLPGSRECAGRRVFIGGYSLAGLFALWAGCQTDCFDGIAAASPSVWFPHFTDYLRENICRVEAVYLSLGDREERTRNPVMAQVGHAIRTCHEILREAGTDCVLEWNRGNHFREPDLRTAKAFAWLMNRIK